MCFNWKFSSAARSASPARSRAHIAAYRALTLELLAVDGLATGTVAAGEVATLEHEVGDDTVEGGALVAETVLARGELTEVASGLGDNIVEEPEDDAARGLFVDADIELRVQRTA